MEIYADHLYSQLATQMPAGLTIEQYQPKIGNWVARLPETCNTKMRVARYWSYPRQAKKLKAGLFHILDHGYAHLLPALDRAKALVTVHDIIPILASRSFLPGVSNKKSYLAEYSFGFIAKFEKIIAVSYSTKQDLVRHLQCSPEKIQVIYPGLNPTLKPLDAASRVLARQQLGLPEQGKLVLISGASFYKNHPVCLKVMEKLQQKYGQQLHLVRLGAHTEEWRQCLHNSPMKPQVTEIPYLPDELLVTIYNAVDCLLFPSLYEGFGWPPLEAMACGTPVVTSNAASLPEVVGDAAIMAKPNNSDELADGLNALLSNPEVRAQQIAKGFANIQRFSWQQSAQHIGAIYQQYS